jgi:hypothetical protein
MKFAFRVIPWIILLIPFIVSAFFYNSIAPEIPVMRSFFGNETISAPKSFFTVFRVPLIEVICAAAIQTIRPKLSQQEYFSIWNVLLYAVAFKSLFQVFEFISTSVFSSTSHAVFFYYLTLATVIIGICLAVVRGRKLFSRAQRAGWQLSILEKAFLGILLIAYFIFAFVPTFIYKTD